MLNVLGESENRGIALNAQVGVLKVFRVHDGDLEDS